ncbi:MAG: hypothetical protein ACOVLC_08135 [Flavobacterium sp.]
MKLYITQFLLAFTFVCFAQTDYTEIYNSEKLISDGIAQHDAENFTAAIALYEKVAKTDPLFLKATYEKLYSIGQADQIETQKEMFAKVYSTDLMDQLPEFYVLYGVFLSNQEIYDQSEEVFKRAEKIIPNASFLNYNMAILYIRMDQPQKAVERLKKCITYNPNHAASHYFMGLLALENGNVAHGCLSLMGYLVNSPAGGFSKDAVLKLNENMGKNFLEKSAVVFSENDDDFSELEVILRNQLSLNQKYKLNSKIDDVVTRQMQAVLEYAASHDLKNGFFEQIYIPTFAAIYKQNFTSGFLAYSLLSLEDQLGKSIKSEKKNIENFVQNFYSKDFWSLYAKRNIDFFGKKETVVIWLEDGKPFMVGKNTGEVKEGKYKIVNEYFQTRSVLTYVNDALEGLQTYYYLNGNISEETYFKAGIREGESKDYYENGKLKAIGSYKNGELDGLLTTFNPYGGKVCELNFSNGVRQGNMECMYADGTKNSSLNYEKNELHGISIYRNQLGDVIGKYSYTNGKPNGDFEEYYDGKILKSKSNYKDGVIQGERILYFENGGKKSVENFVNGNLTMMTNYFDNGSLSSIYTYDENEKLTSTKYYNTLNELYFEEEFKSGLLKNAFQYNEKNEKTAVNFQKGMFELKSKYGILLSKGKIVNGALDGIWQYFYHTGQLKSEDNYAKGIKTGIQKDYNHSGYLSLTYHLNENNYHGLLTRHRYGKTTGNQYFKDDQKHGPFQYFYENGQLSYEGFFTEGEQNGVQIGYRQDGTQLNHRKIYDDFILSYTSFLVDGKTVDYHLDYSKLNGPTKVVSNNGCITFETNYINGYKHGVSKAKDKNGLLYSEANYANNQLNGVYKTYHPNGTLDFVGNYYNNMVHGEALYHDLMGNLRFSTVYIFDSCKKDGTRFYQNKNKLYTYSETSDFKNGAYTYYNIKGEAVGQINFVMDLPVSYQILNSENKLGESIKAGKDFKIISKYNTGATAFEMEFKDHLMDGTISVFDKSGTLNYTCSMKKDDFNGPRNEYYENGKIYKQENFVNNNFEGIQSYFATDGTKLVTATYQEDELHGDFIVYKNNTPLFTKKYNSDELYEILQH